MPQSIFMLCSPGGTLQKRSDLHRPGLTTLGTRGSGPPICLQPTCREALISFRRYARKPCLTCVTSAFSSRTTAAPAPWSVRSAHAHVQMPESSQRSADSILLRSSVVQKLVRRTCLAYRRNMIALQASTQESASGALHALFATALLHRLTNLPSALCTDCNSRQIPYASCNKGSTLAGMRGLLWECTGSSGGNCGRESRYRAALLD